MERSTSPRDRAIALLPYYAGLRISEVVGLDIDDVRLSARRGQLRILGKGRDGGKTRTVAVHPDLRQALQAWIDARATLELSTPALLVNRRGGRLTDRAARTIITTFGVAAGLVDPTRPEQNGFGPHALRHTFATQLVRAGTDLVIVADLLGHETLDTVRLYTAPDDEARANALDALITDQ